MGLVRPWRKTLPLQLPRPRGLGNTWRSPDQAATGSLGWLRATQVTESCQQSVGWGNFTKLREEPQNSVWRLGSG